MPTKKHATWGGRFSAGPAETVQRFTESVSFDHRLAPYDIRGSIAHAKMLARIGVLTRAECAAIAKGLEQIGAEIAAGKFKWRTDLEDVHMNIESELTRRVPVGAKLHTARSRNDQVALDVRLYVRDQIRLVQGDLRDLQWSLLMLAAANDDVIIPGYTHLQRAQPVLLAHHLLAYVEMFDRDHSRLGDAFKRVNVCPLGSGAIAGSTLPLDRESVAKELGFDGVTQNSMDAVSDRDFIVEFLAAGALIAMHVSRLAEDIILWASAEFGFIRIADAYTTGSSLMPQKKNPDIAELARGKTGRVYGNLVALLTLLKGLPMTYNRDLQEDKERLFDTADTLRSTLAVLADMLLNTRVVRERCEAAAADPALLATDLADYLVKKGVPFRQAHHIVGALVAEAEKQGKSLNALPLESFRELSTKFGSDVQQVFDVRKALAARALTGAPSPANVQRQLKRWEKILSR
ncbi:MAG: argininosuccinate lyase [Verrucomicrobia bacterium GWF2_62_7]|nr:MAG: argininosuccinate lyase [Verrucomicrobia bacterium GWF2_62_7]